MNLLGRGRWMQTYSGKRCYPCCPDARDVLLADIAHHLSMLCRFTGATKDFYSVAEHSVWVSRLVPREHALSALLHDATEAYTSDIGRPLKHSWMMWFYRVIEARNWRAIAKSFALPLELHASVHAADNAMCQAERLQLLRHSDAIEWQHLGKPADVKVECWVPREAEQMFLKRFNELA